MSRSHLLISLPTASLESLSLTFLIVLLSLFHRSYHSLTNHRVRVCALQTNLPVVEYFGTIPPLVFISMDRQRGRLMLGQCIHVQCTAVQYHQSPCTAQLLHGGVFTLICQNTETILCFPPGNLHCRPNQQQSVLGRKSGLPPRSKTMSSPGLIRPVPVPRHKTGELCCFLIFPPILVWLDL